jgi:hypothetical protein
LTLTQKIVASLVLSITEILTIENHKLDCTFLHVAFGSQRLLKQLVIKMALIPIEGSEKATRGGGRG